MTGLSLTLTLTLTFDFDFHPCAACTYTVADMEGDSSFNGSSSRPNDNLSPRQREKKPAQPINLANISLDDSKLDQEIALLVSQYLGSRSYGHIARVIDEEILHQPRQQEREEVELVERALTGKPPAEDIAENRWRL